MTLLKIAASTTLADRLHTPRAIVPLDQTDFTDVAALVVSVEDARSGVLAVLRNTDFSIPAFVGIDVTRRDDGVALPAGVEPLWLKVGQKKRKNLPPRCSTPIKPTLFLTVPLRLIRS